jgi:hypothetical protein
MDDAWFDDRHLFLTDRGPLPLDVPFTAEHAAAWGVSRQRLRALVGRGSVRRILVGVYVAAQAPDTVALRAKALSLVVPEVAVVTDRTAAWLHGVDILPRSSRSAPPPVNVFHTTDTRVRRPEVAAGRRGLERSDITMVDGVRVTTALRTALDLGRLLRRHDALAAIDGFLRIGVPHELLVTEIGRFRGYRGVRQLRALAPLGDGRAESPGESALRLDWLDAGLPRPELQVWVYDEHGTRRYRLDMALVELRYAAEYDGEEFHTSEKDRRHDENRRAWCTRQQQWHFEVFDKTDIYDRLVDPLPRLVGGFEIARRRALWTPYGRTA